MAKTTDKNPETEAFNKAVIKALTKTPQSLVELAVKIGQRDPEAVGKLDPALATKMRHALASAPDKVTKTGNTRAMVYAKAA